MNKKVILTLNEMPRACWMCPCGHVEQSKFYFCDARGRILANPDERPNWCPLRPLPDYKPEPDRAGWTNGEPITEELTDWLMDFGFNCCLEAITGGTHDETQDD